MQRITEHTNGKYTLKTDFSTNDAIKKLAMLENMYEDMIKEKDDIIAKLEDMKAQGKNKTVTYNQFLANKLMLINLINRFEIYK